MGSTVAGPREEHAEEAGAKCTTAAEQHANPDGRTCQAAEGSAREHTSWKGGGAAASTAVLDDDEMLLKTVLKEKLHLRQFYVNGTWVNPRKTEPHLLEVIDPSTAQPIAEIAMGDRDDVDFAVKSASDAFPDWSLRTTPDQRRKYVEKILEVYLEHREEMGLLVSREMGAPIGMARSAQAGAGIHHIESFLEVFDSFDFVRTLPQLASRGVQVDDVYTTVLMDPIGVAALITPWNWPLTQITLKVPPALLVGCTCVFKPSEESPLSGLLFAEIVHLAGLPPGVFNLVNGFGETVGQHLSSHPNVDMVSFTGSTRAGAQVSKAAADTFKKVTLELGGKGANIVFDDITVGDDGEDWTQDVLEAGAYMFYNSGQSCNAASRLLVQRSLYGRAIEIAKRVAENTRVDSAHLPYADNGGDEHIGPVVSLRQYERIQNYIQKGIDEGAKLVAGGLGRPAHLNDSKGFYVRPTVFADCRPNMTIFQEEIFGPVLCITPFDTEEEAIQLANDTPYGLTNYVYSRSWERRRRVARALRSGMVEMNDADSDLGSPFGGTRASGVGREGGIYGLEEFCEVKAVTGWHAGEGDLDYDGEGGGNSDDDTDEAEYEKQYY